MSESIRNPIPDGLLDEFNDFVESKIQSEGIRLEILDNENYMSELRGEFLRNHLRSTVPSQQPTRFDVSQLGFNVPPSAQQTFKHFPLQQPQTIDDNRLSSEQIIKIFNSASENSMLRTEKFQSDIFYYYMHNKKILNTKINFYYVFSCLTLDSANISESNLQEGLRENNALAFVHTMNLIMKANGNIDNIKKLDELLDEKFLCEFVRVFDEFINPYLGIINDNTLQVLRCVYNLNSKSAIKCFFPTPGTNLSSCINKGLLLYAGYIYNEANKQSKISGLIFNLFSDILENIFYIHWDNFINPMDLNNVNEDNMKSFADKFVEKIIPVIELINDLDKIQIEDLLKSITDEKNKDLILSDNLYATIFDMISTPEKFKLDLFMKKMFDLAKGKVDCVKEIHSVISNAIDVIAERFRNNDDQKFVNDLLENQVYAELELLAMQLNYLSKLQFDEKTSVFYLSILCNLSLKLNEMQGKLEKLTVHEIKNLQLLDLNSKMDLLNDIGDTIKDFNRFIRSENELVNIFAPSMLEQVLPVLNDLSFEQQLYCCAILNFIEDKGKAVALINLMKQYSFLNMSVDFCNLNTFIDIYNGFNVEQQGCILRFAQKYPMLLNKILIACTDNENLKQFDLMYVDVEDVLKNNFFVWLNVFKALSKPICIFNDESIARLLSKYPLLCLSKGNEQLLETASKFFEYNGVGLAEDNSMDPFDLLDILIKDNRKTILLGYSDFLPWFVNLKDDTFWNFIDTVKDNPIAIGFLMNSYMNGISIFNMVDENPFWQTFVYSLINKIKEVDKEVLSLFLLNIEKNKDLIYSISTKDNMGDNIESVISNLIKLFNKYNEIGCIQSLLTFFDYLSKEVISINSAKDRIISIIELDSNNSENYFFGTFKKENNANLIKYISFIPKKVFMDLTKGNEINPILFVTLSRKNVWPILFQYMKNDYKDISDLESKMKELGCEVDDLNFDENEIKAIEFSEIKNFYDKSGIEYQKTLGFEPKFSPVAPVSSLSVFRQQGISTLTSVLSMPNAASTSEQKSLMPPKKDEQEK